MLSNFVTMQKEGHFINIFFIEIVSDYLNNQNRKQKIIENRNIIVHQTKIIFSL